MSLPSRTPLAEAKTPRVLAYQVPAARARALSRLRSTSEASLAFTGWASCGTYQPLRADRTQNRINPLPRYEASRVVAVDEADLQNRCCSIERLAVSF